MWRCIPTSVGRGPKVTTICRCRWSFTPEPANSSNASNRGTTTCNSTPEAWDRLVTWIDLNVPDHGNWTEQTGGPRDVMQRRLAMRTKYAGRPEDPEVPLRDPPVAATFVAPLPESPRTPHPPIADWPFDSATASAPSGVGGLPTRLQLPLAPGVNLELALVPAGEFILVTPPAISTSRPRAARSLPGRFTWDASK